MHIFTITGLTNFCPYSSPENHPSLSIHILWLNHVRGTFIVHILVYQTMWDDPVSKRCKPRSPFTALMHQIHAKFLAQAVAEKYYS